VGGRCLGCWYKGHGRRRRRGLLGVRCFEGRVLSDDIIATTAREMVEVRAEEAKGIGCCAGVGCGSASGALEAGIRAEARASGRECLESRVLSDDIATAAGDERRRGRWWRCGQKG
jgi:hypothetical protein